MYLAFSATYSFSCWGAGMWDGKFALTAEETKIYESDVVQFILDLKNATFCQKINDGKLHILTSNIRKGENIQYKLAISIEKPGSSVRLLKFTQN